MVGKVFSNKSSNDVWSTETHLLCKKEQLILLNNSIRLGKVQTSYANRAPFTLARPFPTSLLKLSKAPSPCSLSLFAKPEGDKIYLNFNSYAYSGTGTAAVKWPKIWCRPPPPLLQARKSPPGMCVMIYAAGRRTHFPPSPACRVVLSPTLWTNRRVLYPFPDHCWLRPQVDGRDRRKFSHSCSTLSTPFLYTWKQYEKSWYEIWTL